MATEAEAARETWAKVITAEGEMRASHSLKEASDVIFTSLAALQVRTAYSYFVSCKQKLNINYQY
jgi:erythrocyte band 7 integral membrane protein